MSDDHSQQDAGRTGAAKNANETNAVSPDAVSAWMDMLTESARFVSNRLQQDLTAQKAMLECTTPEELLNVQSEFFKEALAQYSQEALRMVEMMSKVSEGLIETKTFGQPRRYDDVPL